MAMSGNNRLEHFQTYLAILVKVLSY